MRSLLQKEVFEDALNAEMYPLNHFRIYCGLKPQVDQHNRSSIVILSAVKVSRHLLG